MEANNCGLSRELFLFNESLTVGNFLRWSTADSAWTYLLATRLWFPLYINAPWTYLLCQFDFIGMNKCTLLLARWEDSTTFDRMSNELYLYRLKVYSGILLIHVVLIHQLRKEKFDIVLNPFQGFSSRHASLFRHALWLVPYTQYTAALHKSTGATYTCEMYDLVRVHHYRTPSPSTSTCID